MKNPTKKTPPRTAVAASALRSARGRPRLSAQALAASRARVLEAAEKVYAVAGERGFTVARVIRQARISRPTFYRWFNSRDEVLEQVVSAANEGLIERVTTATRTAQTAEEALLAALNAYIEWGIDRPDVVLHLYRDMHQPDSVAYRIRGETLRRIVGLITAIARAEGIHTPSLYVEAVLIAIEHVGSQLFSSTENTDAAVRHEHYEIMRNLAMASIRITRDTRGKRWSI